MLLLILVRWVLLTLNYFKNTPFKTLINLPIYNADKC